jgi:aspartyl-tRNA(Asn)/glutamyl-tRNA(Gln) amidotransferase subunit A
MGRSMADLSDLTLVEAGELLRRRALSPVELTEAILARIERLDRQLNAFTTLAPREQVLATARDAEREIAAGNYRGPLHGIPVGVKDLIDTAGLRTTYGSGMFRDHVPAADGAVPARLRAGGAILVGKTATHELGKGVTTNNYFFGPTRNPWNLEHVPGGSSGGAAAAAAAHFGPLHIGTDGGGSIRFPAAFCGVVGHKPTHGLVSNRGQFGGGDNSFSAPGPLVRTVRDAAVATQAIAGFDPDYVYSRPGRVPDLPAELAAGVRGLRVGTSPDLLTPALDPEVRAAHEATLARLAAAGASIVEVRLPHHPLVLRCLMALFGVEAEVHLAALFGDRPRVFSPAVERINQLFPPFDAEACIRAQHDRQRVARDYQAAFCDVDVIVSPVSPFPAPRIDADETRHVALCCPYTGAANLTGMPATALPAGMKDGLPIGIQVMAAPGADALALRVAHALEQAAPEHRVQRPPLSEA